MINNNLKTTERTPLDKGKKSIIDLFEQKQFELKNCPFISTITIPYKAEEVNLPTQNRFLFQSWNRTFLITKAKKSLKIKLLANFVVTDVKECTLKHNDKTNQEPVRFYIVSLLNDKGRIEKNVEISNNSKSDVKQFQSMLNSRYTGFSVCMTEAEFKTFVEEYISPKISSTATIYTNAGVTPQGNMLYENALVTPKEILWADEDGFIKVGTREYLKLATANHYLPKLAKSVKTGTQIANELMTNILECWSENIVLPLLTLGHMVMAIYFEEFTKRYGAPTLILYGETGTGKSTLVTVGLSIFGLSKEALTSGGSTAKSNEYFCSKYNGLNVCIDDVKGETLTSSNFTSLAKSAYNAIARTKMQGYGKEVAYTMICSPLAYSTNESLPELKEVVNRMNIIEIFGKVFKADKFKYHETNGNTNKVKELSLILPEFLKFPKEDVIRLYEENFDFLKENVKDTQNRVIRNISYAYTGAILLLEIANIQVSSLQDKVVEFAQKQVQKYEEIKNVVDRVLVEISTLFDLGILENGNHFKIATEKIGSREEKRIRFKKNVIITAINKYYNNDKKKRIDENAFWSYCQNHKRFRGTHSTRLGEENKSSYAMDFDITGMEEFAEFGTVIKPMSYDDLVDGIERNMA